MLTERVETAWVEVYRYGEAKPYRTCRPVLWHAGPPSPLCITWAQRAVQEGIADAIFDSRVPLLGGASTVAGFWARQGFR